MIAVGIAAAYLIGPVWSGSATVAFVPPQMQPPPAVVLGGRPSGPPPRPPAPRIVATAFEEWAAQNLELVPAEETARAIQEARLSTFERFVDLGNLRSLRERLGAHVIVLPIVVEHRAFREETIRGMTEEELRRWRRERRRTSDRHGNRVEVPFTTEIQTGYRTVLQAIALDAHGSIRVAYTHRALTELSDPAERRHVAQAVRLLLRPLTAGPTQR